MTTRRVKRRGHARPRIELLESRQLLSADAGMWPLANPTADNSVFVRFAENTPREDIQSAVTALGGYIAQSFPDGPAQVVLGYGMAPDEAVKQLQASPFVVYAEQDETTLVIDSTIPNDPKFSSQWALNQGNDVDLDAPQAWDITTGLSSTIVAVTDTGVDYKHPDLYLNIALNQNEIPSSIRPSLTDTNGDGQIDFFDLNSLNAASAVVRNGAGDPINAWATQDRNGNGYIDGGDLLADPSWNDGIDADANGYPDDFIGWNFVTGTNDPWDGHSHGTHVSGIIAARFNNGVGVAGVAGNARILPVKWITDSGGSAPGGPTQAVYYAARNGARVINASWGSGGTGLKDAIAFAGQLGTVFVASAGNDATNTDTTPHYPSGYDLPNIISVAALTSSGALASYSNYGATTVDLGAPGSSILSTLPNGGYGNKSGTSMAAPQVAGVVALLVGLHPEYTATQLVSTVLSTTKPLASLAGRTVTGGMVSAYRALVGAGTPAPDLPAPDGVNATGISTSEIQVGWTSAANARGYVVERSANGTDGWTQAGSVDAAATSFVDGGLASGTTYYYRVRARYDAGTSPPSTVVNATTVLAPPLAPGNVAASTINSDKLRVTWSPVANATGYRIERSPDGQTGWTLVTMAGGGTTTYQDSGLNPNTPYYYRLQATNAAGDSPYSNTATATTKNGR
jgi:subtilisin family serine protease